MSKILSNVKSFLREEDAPTMVEYGLLVALIAVVAAVGVTTLGGQINTLFGDVATSLQ